MSYRVETAWIPNGALGTWSTVQHMRRAVRKGLRDPLTVATAGRIVAGSPSAADRAARIRGFLERRFSFVPDPTGVELLKTPNHMLERIQSHGFATGDCDDAAILGAALGKAVGLRARFRLLGFAPRGPARHVFTELETERGWLELDTTRPAQIPADLVVYDRGTREA